MQCVSYCVVFGPEFPFGVVQIYISIVPVFDIFHFSVRHIGVKFVFVFAPSVVLTSDHKTLILLHVFQLLHLILVEVFSLFIRLSVDLCLFLLACPQIASLFIYRSHE